MDISESPDPQQPQHPQSQQSPQPQFGPQNQQNNDDAGNSHHPADIDVDANLLQQFSCLGTRDHEELINELQKLLDNQLNKDTARFFLEMSNWNLQLAICCYLDFRHFQNFSSMKIVEQSRPSEHSQAWKLQNDGEEKWPRGCYLMTASQSQHIEVPSIQPGETLNIVADIPPTVQATMWRMCTPNGYCFGEPIWMIPSGSDDTASDLAQRMSQLRTSSSEESSPQVNVVILVKMD